MEINPWVFLPFGYLFSILIETPILMVGLSPRHPMSRRVLAGLWLTACTYPVVTIVLPELWNDPNGADRFQYLLVAETFAPVAECLLFFLAFDLPRARGSGEEGPDVAARPVLRQRWFWQDMITITVANLASFGLGELVNQTGFWGWWFSWLGISPV
jgi:hypothetical protein